MTKYENYFYFKVIIGVFDYFQEIVHTIKKPYCKPTQVNILSKLRRLGELC
jgi:hypothetical protein